MSEVEQAESVQFLTPFEDIFTIPEGETAEFSAFISRSDDDDLKIEWFHNGKPLVSGSRHGCLYEGDTVAMVISPVYSNDSGTYTCVITTPDNNKISQEAKLKCLDENELEDVEIRDPEKHKRISVSYDISTCNQFQQNPIIQIEEDLHNVIVDEGKTITLQVKLSPNTTASNTDNMQIQWFHNKKPIIPGNRNMFTWEFNMVTLFIKESSMQDSGCYLVKLCNKRSQATSKCNVSVIPLYHNTKEPICYESYRKIKEMESYQSPSTRMGLRYPQRPLINPKRMNELKKMYATVLPIKISNEEISD